MIWKILIRLTFIILVTAGYITCFIKSIIFYNKVEDGSHTEMPKLVFYIIMAVSCCWLVVISTLWRCLT